MGGGSAEKESRRAAGKDGEGADGEEDVAKGRTTPSGARSPRPSILSIARDRASNLKTLLIRKREKTE